MKRFIRSESGAVSVYLILIIVPIFLFQAVLIDFARIKLAEKESDSAVKAAARSVMSAYDQELHKMGLYGLGISQNESETLFREVFTANLSGQTAAGAFHYIDTRPVNESIRVTPVYSLASHTVFEKQVLEDMKIKAPIEYTLEITDKFRKSGTTPPFQFGTQFSKNAAELERLINQREEALDEAWESAENLHAQTQQYYTYYLARITELDQLAAQIGLHTVDEVKSEMSSIRSQMESIRESISNMDMSIAALSQAGSVSAAGIQNMLQAKSRLAEQAQMLNQKLNELDVLLQLIMKYAALLAATKLEVPADGQVIVQLQQNIEPALRLAKQRNDELRTKIDGIPRNAGIGNENVNEVFQNVSMMGDDYFYKYQTSIASITALFSAFQEVMDSIYLFTPDQTNRANSANQSYNTEAVGFYGTQSLLEKTRMDRNNVISTNKQEQKTKIQAVLDQAKQAMGTCTVFSSSNGDNAMYERLQGSGNSSADAKGLYRKYREANAQETTIGSEIAYDLEKSEPVSLKAMGMLEAFNLAADSLRDELYVNEFALTKFNYRTYGLELDPNGNPKKSSELVDPGAHALKNQEVEYLLYGFSSCGANISSAYAEMFSFRLAIRTVEALLDPKKELLNVGSPLLVLLAAAAEGALLAIQDMSKLIKGEAVELSAKITTSVLRLTYKDYLRVFLMMHSNNTKLMARMQALIELNNSKDLVQETTYLQGYAVSEVRLWFIPQLMKLLDGSGLLGCNVQGNYCRFSQTAAIAY
ncbi:hypothetical protein BC351_12115 [Paenibacillus ferrarius]|uniref:Uncharacterized protein n=1 Tax=Paenibacillus ferrarius TaxID=1469647 RepID=A0A1V4H7W6_9BACL|nr:hypothetical protein [Paenibacillus ferrarius]OPH47241.1 hypothetical protein BC351_12115 [Paenibacillus ferrarius]